MSGSRSHETDLHEEIVWTFKRSAQQKHVTSDCPFVVMLWTPRHCRAVIEEGMAWEVMIAADSATAGTALLLMHKISL